MIWKKWTIGKGNVNLVVSGHYSFITSVYLFQRTHIWIRPFSFTLKFLTISNIDKLNILELLMFRRPHQYCIFWVCCLDLNRSSRFSTGVMNNNENLFFIDQRRLSKRDLINSVILIALGKVMKIDINIKFVLDFIL